MIDFVKKYGKDIDSQNGENGVIAEVLSRIGRHGGIAVEFGAPTKTYCSNINPIEGDWHKWYYDIDPKEPGITRVAITPENVNDWVHNVDVLSIDIDGNDFAVWKAYKGRPAIVIIEINSSLNPDEEFFSPERGASFYTMNKLASEKGYFLLCHTGNCIYVDLEYKDLFPEIHLIVTTDLFFNRSWLPEKKDGVHFKLSNPGNIAYR